MNVKSATLRTIEKKKIAELVELYIKNKKSISLFQKSVVDAIGESEELRPLIHSIKHRMKDPDHLREKLSRKVKKGREDNAPYKLPDVDLFTKINDLAGIRILHLHTKQFKEIDERLKRIFEEQSIDLVEGPFARTWDDESRAYFKQINVKTQESPTMYTSVHYVVASHSKLRVTCEIQVRTLMEEVWGEVDHSINYPKKVEDIACAEQICALARSTSSATRLVDSIFASVEDYHKRGVQVKKAPVKKSKPTIQKTGG